MTRERGDSLRVEVLDRGSGAAPVVSGSGPGSKASREDRRRGRRHGSLGSAPEGGFAVVAEIPDGGRA